MLGWKYQIKDQQIVLFLTDKVAILNSICDQESAILDPDMAYSRTVNQIYR